MKTEEIKKVYNRIDKIVNACEDDYEYMVGNPDGTFDTLLDAHMVLRNILTESGEEVE